MLARRLILLLVSIIVLFALCEVGTRVAFRNMTSTGDGAGYWTLRWESAHVQWNHLGFREKEFSRAAPQGVYRIAVLGDSFTFGQGIDAADRYTNRLELALNQDGRRFEVLNFGKSGFNTVDEVDTLQDVIRESRPHFVLLQWLFNDVEGEDTSGRPRPYPLMPFGLFEPSLRQHSALFSLLSTGWTVRQFRSGLIDSYYDYLRERFGDPASPGSLKATAALADFIDRCRKERIPVGLVLFPSIANAGDAVYPFDYLHDRVLSYCGVEQLPCLDLRLAMKQASQRTQLTVNAYDGHPNAEANRVAAVEIMATFAADWRRAAK